MSSTVTAWRPRSRTASAAATWMSCHVRAFLRSLRLSSCTSAFLQSRYFCTTALWVMMDTRRSSNRRIRASPVPRSRFHGQNQRFRAFWRDLDGPGARKRELGRQPRAKASAGRHRVRQCARDRSPSPSARACPASTSQKGTMCTSVVRITARGSPRPSRTDAQVPCCRQRLALGLVVPQRGCSPRLGPGEHQAQQLVGLLARGPEGPCIRHLLRQTSDLSPDAGPIGHHAHSALSPRRDHASVRR